MRLRVEKWTCFFITQLSRKNSEHVNKKIKTITLQYFVKKFCEFFKLINKFFYQPVGDS